MKSLLAVALFSAAVAGAQTPPSATAILDEAKATAAPEKRVVFLMFHASWCGWCKKLDKFLESPEIKPVIDKYFVTAHVTVEEHGEKKALNSPGGDELFKRVGGPDGLPFFAFLDCGGATIVNSTEPGKDGKRGSNIGYPNAPHEVDWFMAMLSKAVPAMTKDERAILETYLRHP